jgi:hypothetical protein
VIKQQARRRIRLRRLFGQGLLTKAERWLYPGGRPNGLARLLNRAWAIVHGTGLLPQRYVTLEVLGRRTGRMLSFPLVIVPTCSATCAASRT